MKRSDCMPGGELYADPCPLEECRYNLGGGCALDFADDAEGPMNLADIGRVMGLSRERVRQIETKALRKAWRAAMRLDVDLDDIIQRPRHALDLAGAEPPDERGRDRAKLREYRERYAAKQKAKVA